MFKAAPDKLGLKENQRKSFLEAGDLQVSSSKPVTGNGNKKRVEDFEREKVKGKEKGKKTCPQWEETEFQQKRPPMCYYEKTLSEQSNKTPRHIHFWPQSHR